jgi:plasmid replication initiation protein
MAQKSYVGKKITIKAGTKVTQFNFTSKRAGDSIVTVRKEEAAGKGKTRVYWKSNGYLASTTV